LLDRLLPCLTLCVYGYHRFAMPSLPRVYLKGGWYLVTLRNCLSLFYCLIVLSSHTQRFFIKWYGWRERVEKENYCLFLFCFSLSYHYKKKVISMVLYIFNMMSWLWKG